MGEWILERLPAVLNKVASVSEPNGRNILCLKRMVADMTEPVQLGKYDILAEFAGAVIPGNKGKTSTLKRWQNQLIEKVGFVCVGE